METEVGSLSYNYYHFLLKEKGYTKKSIDSSSNKNEIISYFVTLLYT